MTEFKRAIKRVVILQGDDQAKLEELRLAVASAQRRANLALPRLGDSEPADVASLVAEHDAFLEEASERAALVELQALGRRQWRSLVAAHPPRDGNEQDQSLGVNEESFGDALVPASIVAPVFDTPADRDAFLDSLSDAQFDQLYATAYSLNKMVGADPKGLSLGSAATPKSDET
jgi:hypothetical protein